MSGEHDAPPAGPPPESADGPAWASYWRERGQPWRTEPEVSASRAGELARRRAQTADTARGVYPFKDVALSRADVEWLLATHDEGRGPVDWHDAAQRTRPGLDLRGADLREARLAGLPLAGLLGGLAADVWRTATVEQLAAAHLRLEGADLSGAHLEGAVLEGARLEAARLDGACLVDANLRFAVLDAAYLSGADLRGASLVGASLVGALLPEARLEGADLGHAVLAGAELYAAHLEGARLRETHLAGRHLAADEVARLRRWRGDLPDVLPGADLGGAFLDPATILDDARLGDAAAGSAALADMRWGGVNLAVLDWCAVRMLGDEFEARQPITRYGKPKDEATRLDELHVAVRANRQLAVALRDQGLSEEADRFAYRALLLQRRLLLRQAMRRPFGSWRDLPGRVHKLGAFVFSLFLDLLAGYGYRPGRSLALYLGAILGFARIYALLGADLRPPLSPLGALIFSLTSFHGRGFFPGGIPLDAPLTVVAALEAVVGLIIELSFIATFTQRYFGR
jgi:uncharacterized protein YjbI with pentapeptide repeats